MKGYKLKTRFWAITPCFFLHNNKVELAWLKYGVVFNVKHRFSNTHLIPYVFYRDTYFNELGVEWLKHHLFIYTSKNTPPRWDKKTKTKRTDYEMFTR